MRMRSCVLVLAAMSVLLSACGPSHNQPSRASDRTKVRFQAPKTQAEAAQYAESCDKFGQAKEFGASLVGLLRCYALAKSDVATDDQLYIANLRVCQLIKSDKKSDVRKGLSHCWKAVELRPNSGEAYRARGLALARSKSYALALPDLDKAISISEADNPRAYSARGFVRSMVDDVPGGIADVVTARRKYAEKGEKPPISLFAMQSHMHLAAEQMADARAALAAGREIAPEHPDLYRMEALLELADEDLEDALAAVNKAIKLKPTLASGYAIRGSIYGQQGKMEDMARDYRVASRYDKKWTALKDTLKRIDSAFALTKEALRVLGHDPGSKGPGLTPDARNAMLAFQKAEGLPQDGKFNDPSLTQVLRKADAQAQSAPEDPLDLIKRLMRDPKASAGAV